MYNFHPVLAAFPLSLISVVVLLELLAAIRKVDLTATIEIVLSLAVISVVAAFFSGYQGSEFAQATFQVPQSAIDNHHLLGKWLLFVVVPTLGLFHCAKQARYAKDLFRLMYGLGLLTCWALTLWAGALGAELVFKHGAAVEAPLDAVRRDL